MIVLAYNRFNDEIIRILNIRDEKARDLNIYDIITDNYDMLSLKLRYVREGLINPGKIINIKDLPSEHSCPSSSIGVLFHGGLGDHVIASALIAEMKRVHGNIEIEAFCYKCPEMLEIYNEIKAVHKISRRVKSQIFAQKQSVNYETFYDLGLIGGRYEDGRLVYAKYPTLYQNLSASYSEIAKRFNEHIVFPRSRSVGLFSRIDQIDLIEYSEKRDEIFLYVTISAFSKSKVKMWPGWQRVIEYLQDNGIRIIQLGDKETPSVINTEDKRDIPISETINLIRNANLHIGIDNGLVHLARAVGTQSLVLYGPSYKKNWSYRENINITSDFECPHYPCFGKPQYGNCPFTDDVTGKCMNQILFHEIIKSS